MRTGATVLILLAAMLVSPAPVSAQTNFQVTANRIDAYVEPGDDAEDTDPLPDGCTDADCSLREAVIDANANPGADTITFAEAGEITLTLFSELAGDDASVWDLDIADEVRIGNPAPDVGVDITNATEFLSGPEARIFDITAPVLIQNLGVSSGMQVNGDGGLIRATDQPLTLIDVNLGGGEAEGRGGAIAMTGTTLEIFDGTLIQNRSGGGGGAISVDDYTNVTISNSLIGANGTTGNQGGAVMATGGGATAELSITGSHLEQNSIDPPPGGMDRTEGGAVFVEQGQLEVAQTLFASNGGFAIVGEEETGTGFGGSIYAAGPTFVGLGDPVIPGVQQVDITDTIITGSRAAGNGGAIYLAGESTTIDRTLIRATETGFSGAVHVLGGTVRIRHSTISDSTGVATSVVESRNGGETTIEYSTLTDSLVSAEFSQSQGRGEPAFLGGPTAAIVGNVRLFSTIVSDHDAPATCAGEVSSLGHNIVDDDDCALTEISDLANTDPLIGPLEDNEGPRYGIAGDSLDGATSTQDVVSQTHRLLEGSPALDSADPSVCGSGTAASDQRLVARPQGEGCDRGAYEQIVGDPDPEPDPDPDPGPDPDPDPDPDPGPGTGDGCTASAAAATDPPITTGMNRIEGLNRIQTAIIASQAICGDGQAPAVVLTRADAFPDAQAGTPLAIAQGAPLLLSNPDTLDPETQGEIQRILPLGGIVYLLGGTVALSDTVEGQLQTLGYETVRFGGVNRFQTATIIAEQGLGDPDTLLIANGGDFADSIVAGAAASAVGDGTSVQAAVLLTSGADVPPETAAYLDGRTTSPELIAIGASAGLAYPAAEQVSGANRFLTALAVADRFFSSPTVIGVARADDFPDGLSGGAVVGRPEIGPGPVVLVSTDALPEPVRTWLVDNAGTIDTAITFGGTAAVSEAVQNDIATALGL